MIIIEAILKINPNAKVSITDNDINQIEWLDGTTPIAKTDIEAKQAELQTEMANAEQRAIDKKASGKAKLKALGLDDEEIKSIMGI